MLDSRGEPTIFGWLLVESPVHHCTPNQRNTGAAGTWSQIAAVGPNVRTYRDTGLALATTYGYRVCACNAGGDSIWSNEASATTHPTLDVKTWPLYR